MGILTAIQETTVATWVRESPSLFGFTGILFLHAVGLAFAVGVSAAIDLRILGVAPRLPLAPMEKLFPVIWVGFWINALSGVPLLMANAEHDLINPTFYAKMLFIALAVVSVRKVRRHVFRDLVAQPVLAYGEGRRDNPIHHGTPLGGRGTFETTAAAVLNGTEEIVPPRAKFFAVVSLFLWAAAIVAGRLCEYPELLGLDYLR